MNLLDRKIHKGKITSINEAAQDMYFISFETGYGLNIKPGQFVSILCEGLTLRRPFSVASYFNGQIGILIKLKGKGTKYLSSLKIGDEIDFIGALGNGFNIENKKSLLIGAGVGVAPLFYLNNELKSQKITTTLASGFLNKANIPQGINIDEITTDDGSLGKKGSIINYIGELIDKYQPEKIYSCGPHIVLKKISEAAETYGLSCEVAMEKVMACGIGVCRGCVIKLKNGQNASVCQNGPVFKGDEIKW